MRASSAGGLREKHGALPWRMGAATSSLAVTRFVVFGTAHVGRRDGAAGMQPDVSDVCRCALRKSKPVLEGGSRRCRACLETAARHV